MNYKIIELSLYCYRLRYVFTNIIKLHSAIGVAPVLAENICGAILTFNVTLNVFEHLIEVSSTFGVKVIQIFIQNDGLKMFGTQNSPDHTYFR